jgi:hypothetical protein
VRGDSWTPVSGLVQPATIHKLNIAPVNPAPNFMRSFQDVRFILTSMFIFASISPSN